jgi:hypothetical protein
MLVRGKRWIRDWSKKVTTAWAVSSTLTTVPSGTEMVSPLSTGMASARRGSSTTAVPSKHLTVASYALVAVVMYQRTDSGMATARVQNMAKAVRVIVHAKRSELGRIRIAPRTA